MNLTIKLYRLNHHIFTIDSLNPKMNQMSFNAMNSKADVKT